MTTQYEQHLETMAASLQNMHDYLIRVEKGCDQIALAFQTGSPGNGLEMIVQVIEGLTYLLSLAKSAETLFKMDLAQIFINTGYSGAMLVGELNRVCGAISQAAEAKDYSLLGDLVEYDMRETVVQAQKMIEAMYQKLEENTEK